MGRLPYRSRALGTVMAAAAGGDYRQRRRGDAFCAGLLYGSHERWPLTASLQLAHACARASLQAVNAIDGAKTLPELQAFIQLQNG